jgi:hypothetical protein
VSDPIFREQERLPDGTLSGPENGPWAKWHVEAFADKVAGLHVAAAIVLCATALFIGPLQQGPGLPVYPMAAPLVGALYLLALVIMFTSRDRHGLVRALLGLGAALLAVVALWFGRSINPARLLWPYWIPALLGLTGVLVLAWGHRAAHAVEADFQAWRRQRA